MTATAMKNPLLKDKNHIKTVSFLHIFQYQVILLSGYGTIHRKFIMKILFMKIIFLQEQPALQTIQLH